MKRSDREKLSKLKKAERKLSKKAKKLDERVRQGQRDAHGHTTDNTASNQSKLSHIEKQLKKVRGKKRSINRRNRY
jgi:hypothetical protein